MSSDTMTSTLIAGSSLLIIATHAFNGSVLFLPSSIFIPSFLSHPISFHDIGIFEKDFPFLLHDGKIK